MKKLSLFLALCSIVLNNANAQWKPAGNKIMSTWGENIDPSNVLPEYPRPIMERSRWMNLNGLWDYSITPKDKIAPQSQGKILVPFAVESALSGVGRHPGQDNVLWYDRTFEIPASWKGENVLLHFGAVDWKCDVWINQIKVGSHTGGYTPFYFDITSALLQKGANTIRVAVWDPTDDGHQPRGKQVANPKGIWYTPVSGIWQTVWLEPVGSNHISGVRTTPDLDAMSINFHVGVNSSRNGDIYEVKVSENGKPVASAQSLGGQVVTVRMPDETKLWSPDSPFLYDVEVVLKNQGVVKDKIKSYAAMRKFSTIKDDRGIVRITLNNKPLFQFGTLDQGWWPDGLYTAPSDEALLYDVIKTKELGFNMIRKHVKVEPARWYTHCDRLGMIVWQDMPNGDKGPQWQGKKYFDGVEMIRTSQSEATYRKEWSEIMDYLHSYPSIGMWVPFNEAWGQFKTAEIAEATKQADPSRLVNPASGGNHYTCGDVLDLHDYPNPRMYLFDPLRVNVMGEYGGIGLVIKEHLWEPDRNWGYVHFENSEAVTAEYVKYARELLAMIPSGFSAAVYTQTTDVEIEVNGLMTYDRKVMKLNAAQVAEINSEICRSLDK